jgi:hypothetical protein
MQPSRRKRRTREHVIADLSANHLEKHALLCGFSVERVRHDYGYDLWVATYNRKGEPENGLILVQLKATDQLKVISRGQEVTYRVEREDLHQWLGEMLPVILVVYDARADVAYWLYVQQYFEGQPGFNLSKAPAQLTVRIPKANVINRSAMRRFADYRDAILAQTGRVTHHAPQSHFRGSSSSAR